MKIVDSTKKRSLKLLVTGLLTTLIVVQLKAQSSDNTNWSPDFGSIGATGNPSITNIRSAIVASDGVYVGGIFTQLDGKKISTIAFWDGMGWEGIGAGRAGIYTMLLDGNNLYVGGEFFSIGNTPANNVAVYNTETKIWTSLGVGVNGPVHDIIKVGDNVFVAGNFKEADIVPTGGIARFDGSRWDFLGQGVNGTVYDLETKNGFLYAAGDFTESDGSPAANLASWDGETWSEFGGGTNGPVYEIAAIDTSIYIGGAFSEVNGITTSNLARWDGSTWNSYSDGPNGSVYTIKNTNEGLVVGGEFTEVGINNAVGIARLNEGNWETTSTELMVQSGEVIVYDVAIWQNDLITVGYFSGTDAQVLNHVALLDTNLNISPATEGGKRLGVSGIVYATQIHETTGDLYIGGAFSYAGNSLTRSVARWNGFDWLPIGDGVNGTVEELLIAGDVVYIGGSFTEAGGIAANNIAGYNINDNTWFSLGSGTDDVVYSMHLIGNDLYVGGRFTSAGGITSNNIAQWNTETNNWAALNLGMNNDIYALADYNGLLLAGGLFTTADGNSANHIAAWDGNGWLEFEGGTDGEVDEIKVKGNELYIGGIFTNVNGLVANNIAMWNGSDWSALGTGLDRGVITMTFIDNILYAGGFFEFAGVIEVNNVAGWDGSNWFSLGDGLEQSNLTGTVVWNLISHENNLYIGGSFDEAGNSPASNISLWDLSNAPVSIETKLDQITEYRLNQNYPNPFNPSTVIDYTLPKSSMVTLKIYTLMGQEVATLVEGEQSAGEYSVNFNASNYSSGVYFYQLTAENTSVTKRMTLIK